MDPDELTKEVYAYFGLAIYGAQVLEHGLANAMVFSAKLAGRLPTLADYDAFLEEKFERTLGALIKDLANHIQVDPTLETCLATALRKRNWLAHRYFRERALDFVTVTCLDSSDQGLLENRLCGAGWG